MPKPCVFPLHLQARVSSDVQSNMPKLCWHVRDPTPQNLRRCFEDGPQHQFDSHSKSQLDFEDHFGLPALFFSSAHRHQRSQAAVRWGWDSWAGPICGLDWIGTLRRLPNDVDPAFAKWEGWVRLR